MKTKENFITHFIKITLIAAGVFLLLSSSAQDVSTSFEDWDSNRDERIYENEFNEYLYDRTYGTDVVQEKIFDEDQFFESAYDWWDANHDLRLDQTEWDFGFEHSYGEYLDDDFDVYDLNSDGYLDNDEFYDSFNDSDYYSSWDSNNDDLLDYDEYSTGTFNTWDLNDDSFIDENEFDNFNRN